MTLLTLQSGEAFLRSTDPDSRDDSRLGKELNERLIRMADRPEPEPMEWVWDGLIPAGFATSMIGDGGTGKSMFAFRLAFSIALGESFLGRVVQRGDVLILDAELNEGEALRRVHRIRRGLGLDRLPGGLAYMQLTDSLGRDETLELCLAAIERVRPRLTILDSFSVACAGLDLNGPEDMIELMNAMKKWGSCLMLDHIPKATVGNMNAATVRAYGTVFKFNLVRSALQLARLESGAIRLAQIKSNFGALQPPIGIEMSFGDDTVTMQDLPIDDEELPGVRKVSTADRVLHELETFGVDGADARQLAEKVGVELKTVRNVLTELKREGAARSGGGGRWIASACVEEKHTPNDRPHPCHR